MVISREKVRDLLGKLRADKAAGVDELSPRMMLHFENDVALSGRDPSSDMPVV